MTRRADDRGVVTVETALVLPVLLALLGGVLLFGLRMWATANVDQAAQAGMRAASLRGATQYHQNDSPYTGTSGYLNQALVRTAAARELPGQPAAVPCTGTGASADLPAGADLCVAVTQQPESAAVTTPDGETVRPKLQGDLVSVTVVQRVQAVRAASQFVPVVGDRLAARFDVVRATALGRLE